MSYQASIRNKKNHIKFNQIRDDNYPINIDYEEYAYVQKMLGNCRVKIITNSGIEAIGIIRGSLRKFNKRVVIECGDIVIVSKRDYQDNKVDIVHKYNVDQIQSLIINKSLSQSIINNYNNKQHHNDNLERAEDNNSFNYINNENDNFTGNINKVGNYNDIYNNMTDDEESDED